MRDPRGTRQQRGYTDANLRTRNLVVRSHPWCSGFREAHSRRGRVSRKANSADLLTRPFASLEFRGRCVTEAPSVDFLDRQPRASPRDEATCNLGGAVS